MMKFISTIDLKRLSKEQKEDVSRAFYDLTEVLYLKHPKTKLGQKLSEYDNLLSEVHAQIKITFKMFKEIRRESHRNAEKMAEEWYKYFRFRRTWTSAIQKSNDPLPFDDEKFQDGFVQGMLEMSGAYFDQDPDAHLATISGEQKRRETARQISDKADKIF